MASGLGHFGDSVVKSVWCLNNSSLPLLYGAESVPKIEIFYEGENFHDIPRKLLMRVKIFMTYLAELVRVS